MADKPFMPEALVPYYRPIDDEGLSRMSATRAEVEAAIARIESADFATVTVDELKTELVTVFRGYAFKAPQFNAGSSLYRARRIPASEVASTPLDRYADLGAPPASKTPLGRCNRKGQPIFYCAAGRNTAIFESCPAAGDHVLLTMWRTTKDLVFNQVGFSELAFSALHSTRQPRDYRHRGAGEVAEKNRWIYEWLARQFTHRDDSRYKLTNAIAEKLLAPFCAGITYPTVAMNANGDNFAVTLSQVDSALECVWARRFVVKARSLTDFEIEELDFAAAPKRDAPIPWTDRMGRWTFDWPESNDVKDLHGEIFVDGQLVDPT
jgi:hypothetical protein